MKFLKWFLLVGLMVVGIGAYVGYSMLRGANVAPSKDGHTLFIPSGSVYEEVVTSLVDKGIIKNETSFRKVAELKKYPQLVKAGKYKIKSGWSNTQLVNHLRLGTQEPVKVVINQARTIDKFVSAATRDLEADSTVLISLLNDTDYVQSLGFNDKTIIGLFIPDTYQFNWNTSEKEVVDRMVNEYKKFWNDERLAQAKKMNMTPEEVSTLASIVDEETYHTEEMDDVAGVYLNRLERGISLDADPTVKFAMGDPTIKRVLLKHLEVDSPYNTYRNAGLPPGPICLPSKQALEAVLNPAEHDYIYFCAKPDFSMYHAFATNLREHNLNAKRYHNALNRKKIFR